MKLGRALGEEEAFAIVEETVNGPIGDRGLAIWAIGQKRLWSVLDRIWAQRTALTEREMARLSLDLIKRIKRGLRVPWFADGCRHCFYLIFTAIPHLNIT